MKIDGWMIERWREKEIEMDGEQVIEQGEPEIQSQVPSQTDGQVDDEMVAKARRMGWTDQDEFRGNPDRWVDAATYVARADEHLPILKGTVAAMDKKMAAQEALIADQNARIKAMQADFKEFVGFTRAAEERAYKKALEELKAEQRQAVEDQDLAKFDQVSADIDHHLKNNPAATSLVDGQPDGVKETAGGPAFSEAVYTTWLGENQWYTERPKMAVYAQQIDTWLTSTKPTMSQAEKLAEITKQVKAEFPDFWSPRRSGGSGGKGSPVEGSDAGGVVVSKDKRGYANLPPEARAACDKFCGVDGKGASGTIPGYTRDQYLKDYDWES